MPRITGIHTFAATLCRATDPRSVTLSDSAVATASPSVERDAVARAAAGDVTVFDALIRPRLPRLVRLARAMLRDESAALDVVQEASVRAWRELPRLRDQGAFDAWLGQIVVNGCRSALRRRRRVEVREIPMDVVGGPAGAGAGSASATIGDEVVANEAIRRAMGRVAPDDRALLVLHYLEDRPLAEIATGLRIPVGTVKWRLSRARAALERALEAER